MAQFDLIMKSIQEAWDADYSPIIPTANFYYDRAQKPVGVAGFPYAEVRIEEEMPEPTTDTTDDIDSGRLVTYHVEILVWTCQGMTGASSSGDQMTDQGLIMRALEAVLSYIPPNAAWNYVAGFAHCLEGMSSLEKDPELYLGGDVYISTNNWDMLVTED